MKIKNIFDRDIARPINGVVKADQVDEDSIYQELDEYVITRELRGHFHALVDVLDETLGASAAVSGDKNGVWVSGFFGSGKSHFIKVMSYVLENEAHGPASDRKPSVEFFDAKFDDPTFYSDMKTVAEAGSETILFNVDTKADQDQDGRSLLGVFLKVFNEHLGYSSDHPHIANLERHLDKEGKLEEFHRQFEAAASETWKDCRDAWEFRRDELIEALTKTLGQSEASVNKWVDGGEENFSSTIENFAECVRDYLATKPLTFRLFFLVDEVGAFIGTNSRLMLNLQTITEQLGTICEGRAWVLVTSQEDLDAVFGNLIQAPQHHFSKIQGRFDTRLSLSSSNVDEVIQSRLLEKSSHATTDLKAAYEGNEDILKNQLAFHQAGMTFKGVGSFDDFSAAYPFPPYQFTLVQKVFESIRRAGATGIHVSRGERSTLDAFQTAALTVSDNEVGVLVPFVAFYPAVEGFLDTTVKATINQAAENHALQPVDVELLKVLFLIRYIDELPGNVDNLVTLCIRNIDADRLALRRQIEASLARLESETLIARNGDLYLFLTNEERDIGREIKNTTIPSGSEARELGKMIFEDLLGETRKHTYSLTGRDFGFNRQCDDHYVGNQQDGTMEVAVVSPLGDRFGEFESDEAARAFTIGHADTVIVRLPDDDTLARELRSYIQTETYIKGKHGGGGNDSTTRVLKDQADHNRTRRKRLGVVLKDMLEQAAYFASGERLDQGSTNPKDALGRALESLIKNTYSKMGYLEYLSSQPKQELQSILRANDVDQAMLGLPTPESNKQALDDLRDYVRLSHQAHHEINLEDLVEKRYGGRPYGWPELETLLLVARLVVLQEIELFHQGQSLPAQDAYDKLLKSTERRRIRIAPKAKVDDAVVRKAQSLGLALFAEQGPDGDEKLYGFCRTHLDDWHQRLRSYGPLAESGEYPGHEDIDRGLGVLRPLVGETDPVRFLDRFVDASADLKDLGEDLQDLRGFYDNQRSAWDRLRSELTRFESNETQLESDNQAGSALARLREIVKSPRPYALIAETGSLVDTVRAVNDGLVTAARPPVLEAIASSRSTVEKELASSAIESSVGAGILARFDELATDVQSQSSIAHIEQARSIADHEVDSALAKIEAARNAAEHGENPKPTPPAKAVASISARDVAGGKMLESKEDVESYLGKLRKALETAIQNGRRIRIK